MTRSSLSLAILASLGLSVALLASGGAGVPSHKLTAVSLKKMADCLHAVIAAHHEVYCRSIHKGVPGEQTSATSSVSSPEATNGPTHARVLDLAEQEIQTHGAEFSYALRSAWPIDESHGPQTQVELDGLKRVAAPLAGAWYSEETLGGRGYYTAIYPVIATESSCVECHNHHPRSPRRDYRPKDVMGAIVVRLPLEF